jgi:ATP/maltotriose-dependent transcriptional regulator MalT
VRAQLLEIRTADLAFTTAETAAFLSDTMGLALSEAAALQLAGASTALLAYVRRLCDAASQLEVSVALHQSDESPAVDRSDGTLEAPLTSRELAILRLLATGRSNQKIADQLIIAVSTVKWHLRLIYNKLGAANRTEAAARARGIIR